MKKWTRSAGSLFQRKMHIFNSRQRCEFVRTKEDACDGCIFSVTQNMTETGWRQDHGLPCKT